MFLRASRLIAGAVILIALLTGAAWAQNTLSVSPTSLVFAAQSGSTAVQSQSVQVLSSGTQMAWYAQLPAGSPSWLGTTTPNGFTSTNNLVVTINPTGLTAGSYSGTVQVYSPSSSNAPSSLNPLSISVSLTVGATGTITLSTNTKTLSATVGGANPFDTVQLSTSSATSIIVTASPSSSGGWLSVTPSSATLASGSPATFTISANIATLAANAYSGAVTFTSGTSTQTLNVTLNVTPGSTITASPNPVSLTAQSGTTPVSQQVTVSNTTGGTVTVTPSISAGAGWLTTSGAVSIAAGGTGIITFTANPTGQALGTLTGQVTLTPSGGGSALQVPVYFTVSSTPSLSLSKSAMTFNTTTSQLTDSFNIINTSASSITYNVSVSYATGSNWLSINPLGAGTVNASTQQIVNVSALSTGLTIGNYYATITVTPTSGGGSPQTVSVTLSVGGSVAVSASPTSLTVNAPGAGQSGQATVQISSINSAVTVAPESINVFCSGFFCATVSPGSYPASPGVPATFTVTSSSALSIGTYSGTIRFNTSPSVGSIDVPVTINVGTGTGGVTVTPSSLSLSAPVGGGIQSAQLYISGTTGLTFTATTSTGWLNVGTIGSGYTTGYLPGYVNVYANPGTLTAGTYTGSITISGGSGGSQTVFVSFVVGGGSGSGLTVSPATLTFSAAPFGGATPVQSINVSGTSTTIFNATANTQSGGSWLVLNTFSGTTPGAIQVQANATGLAAGTYYGTINVTSGIGSQTVNVTFAVGGSGAVTASPTALSFVTPVNTNPSSQSVQVSAGGGVVAFTAAASTNAGGNWLSVSPTSANTTGTLVVSVNAVGLAAGSYTGQISISSSAGSATVSVSLIVGGTGGVITASPTSLQFSAAAGGVRPPAQQVQLSVPSGSVSFTVTVQTSGGNWMAVSPPAGTITTSTPQTLDVYVEPGSLPGGNYTGSLLISGGGGTTIVQVSFVVGGGSGGGTGIGGGLMASPASVTLTAAAGSTALVMQTISLTSTTGSAMFYTAFAQSTTGVNWLSLQTTSGTTPGTLVVQANPFGLASGVYSGTISVSTNLGSLLIPVTFNYGTSGSSGFVITPTSLSFTGQAGASLPATQNLFIQSSSGFATTFSATVSSGGGWLQVTPSSGFTPATLVVGVNTTGLAAGTYNGSISLAGSDGFIQQTVQVTLTVTSANLVATPASLSFTAGSGANAAGQTLAITSGLGAVPYTVSASMTSGGNWLTVTPSSGTTPGSVTVTANATGLSAGTYTGTVNLASGSGGATVPVTFTVTQPFTMTVAPETLAFEAQAGAASIPARTVSVNISTGNMPFTATVTTSAGGNWLAATPASGTTPGTVTVTANPSGLAAGTYTGTVSLAVSGATNTPRTVAVTLAIASPAPVPTAVLSSASGNAGILSAGALASIYGQGLGPNNAAVPQIVTGGLVPTTVGEVRVLFDGIAAPILYAQARQVNVVVPWSLFGRTTVRVEVEYRGNRSAAVQVQLFDASPAIFSLDGSGQGQGAILNQNYSVNGSGNGADPGEVILIYGSGMGQTEPLGVDGSIPTVVLPKPLLPVSVLIGNSEAELLYAGAAPGLVSGAVQVNARVPRGLQPGVYPVTLRIGRFSSQLGVTVVVK